MKTRYKTLAAALAAALLGGCAPAFAAVPVAWTNTPATPQPYPVKPVPHGSTVDFRVTLNGYTSPPIAPGADVRLWYQTNGMGQAWWSAPAAISGNVITATFGPAQDTGADRVSLFFGAPSNAFASAVLRLTHAPGFAPSAQPLPVQRLDFSLVEVANAPYYTRAEAAAYTAEATNALAAQAESRFLPRASGVLSLDYYPSYDELQFSRSNGDSIMLGFGYLDWIVGGAPKSLRFSDVALKSDIPDVSGKQDAISDLAAIRAGAALGATALQNVPTATDTIAAEEYNPNDNSVTVDTPRHREVKLRVRNVLSDTVVVLDTSESGTLATREWVRNNPPAVPSPSDDDPSPDGVAWEGESNDFSRSDHVHPTDTSRASASDLAALAQEMSGKVDKSGGLQRIYTTGQTTGPHCLLNPGSAAFGGEDEYGTTFRCSPFGVTLRTPGGSAYSIGWPSAAGDFALASDTSYALVAVTPANGAVALQDRAVNNVTLSAAATLSFPQPAQQGLARDFVVRLTLDGSGSSVPAVTWPSSVEYETDDGEWPDLSEGGTYIVRLTEVAAEDSSVYPPTPARFLIQASKVATATPGGAS